MEEPSPLNFSFITSEDLLNVAAPDNSHVWIVGLNATILHSNDGGNTWIFQKSPQPSDFISLSFTDTEHGWIIGTSGSIIRTEDGGSTWFDISEKGKTENRLMDVCFINNQQGWIVGVYGTILHTEDGGETWENQGWEEDRIYNSVKFIDDRRGWIVGEYGTLYHTGNGGKTWEPQECKDIIPVVDLEEFAPPTPSLYGVYFSSADRGWAVGLDGVIIVTEDGGTSWNRLMSPVDLSLFRVKVIETRGWAVGLRGNFIVSDDGGKRWIVNDDALPTKFWLRGLAFSDQNHGWIVGSRGTIIRTTDGGATWEMKSGITVAH